MNAPTFDQLPLLPVLQDTVLQLGFTQMTPIQEQALPLLLEGKDVIAQAKTGSGKTAAFALPILQKIDTSLMHPQALILCPTRELAAQVAEEFRRLARSIPNVKVMTITGGLPMQRQVDSLAYGVHIVVATPGRFIDHIDAQSLSLRHISTLVLDEADRMIDMGFYEDISHIVAACPAHRQTALFSATYPDTIGKDATQFVRDAIHVQADESLTSSQITSLFYEVTDEDRFDAVMSVLQQHQPSSALIFCNTKANSDALTYFLRSAGFSALVLHGDLDQRDRDEVLIQFANHSCSILVATDVAARGLDIEGLPMVINAELPRHEAVYVHRIGRTGRVDQTGIAVNLCDQYDGELLKFLQAQGIAVEKQKLPAKPSRSKAYKAPMITLVIVGGKRDKLRPGDILGALTGDVGLQREQVGKINVGMVVTHLAIERSIAEHVIRELEQAGIKGKSFRVHKVRHHA